MASAIFRDLMTTGRGVASAEGWPVDLLAAERLLAIARGLTEQGVAADFRATGQTGILIAGSGIAIDAVVAQDDEGLVL